MSSLATLRKVRIFRYDPETGGEGAFQEYSLAIDNPGLTTILDVLIRIQKEQDPGVAFRFACRVNMCGSCGMVINGREGLACKTNVSDLPSGQDITLRPLNHFPVIKDLVVDMGPFFDKYEDALPFFEPREPRDEPYRITPDNHLRVDIGMATDCIACGCCVSSCTMVNHHQGYAGPAALNRAFTLLADERDALFAPRLTRALESCYNCRTEFNCTEVCPKSISGTRAIKYIQRLALKNLRDIKPIGPHPAELSPPAAPLGNPARPSTGVCACGSHAESQAGPPGTPAAMDGDSQGVGHGPCAGAGGATACSPSSPTAARMVPTNGLAHDPAKPKAASCCCQGAPADPTRRSFMTGGLVTGLVGAGVLLSMGTILGVSAVQPTLAEQPKQWVPAGLLETFPIGGVSTVMLSYTRVQAFHKERVNAPVLVRRDGEREFIFFSSACPHLGCSVSWDAPTRRFKCACHGGAFDLDGAVVAGPPPSPLPRLPWKIENGEVLVEVV